MLIDTHAHLTADRFTGEVDAVVARAIDAGVDRVVTIASDLDDARAAVRIAEDHSSVYATVGVHPHAAERWNGSTPAAIRELASHPRVVGIGETGLDFYYDNAPRASQEEAFRGQLEIAAELDLPAVVHAREADEEVARAIREVGWSRGVLHCFSGGARLLEEALALGWYVSFAGMVTFSKWDAHDLLRAVPADRLLIETDSPYLAPVPHRGKRNEPAYVRHVAERAAEIRGVPAAELMATTTANARAFYRIPGP